VRKAAAGIGKGAKRATMAETSGEAGGSREGRQRVSRAEGIAGRAGTVHSGEAGTASGSGSGRE
jgi:hypothetical protein